ncbi:hypothetical protein QVD17_40976 [Tagetes erecta]|uniref:Uncharacterized protein n=1 Tax=Tagetes erecta TaxID=13708 RepID=A0AAD8JUE0_TARER|nr:hypothetical protein QVD17_40976 [Tagetes erecta]
MARACDSCVRKKARWYCPVDDVFLCGSCDASVHPANQSSGRHQRVLLQTTSCKIFGQGELESKPTWHEGFTRRARTPRARQRTKCSFKVEGNNRVNSSVPLVPEIGSLEASLLDDVHEEELLYLVPVLDPFETQLCNNTNDIGRSLSFTIDDLHGFDDTSCRIEEDLGLSDNFKEEDNARSIGICFDESKVKVEDKEVEAILGFDFDATMETLDWDFDIESSTMIKEETKVAVHAKREHMINAFSVHCNEGNVSTPSMILRLNYEEVINTWGDQGSPWISRIRPQLNSDGSWPDIMGSQWMGNNNPSYEGVRGNDGGREARVSRYREKRRSRLFSKKIRYEVRKLNAEKRPRMKGRFVKRETFKEPSSTSSYSTYAIKN